MVLSARKDFKICVEFSAHAVSAQRAPKDWPDSASRLHLVPTDGSANADSLSGLLYTLDATDTHQPTKSDIAER